MIPGFSTLKLIGFGLGALALIGAFFWFRGVLNERAELREWQAEVITATREASANPKLDEKQVALQIRLIGKSLSECKGAIGRQNAAVDKLGSDTKAAAELAARASSRAAERVNDITSVVGRLEASARSTGPRDACKPSEALVSAWH